MYPNLVGLLATTSGDSAGVCDLSREKIQLKKMKDAGWTVKRIVFNNGVAYGTATRWMVLAIIIAACCLAPVAMLAASTITYVQSAYATPQSPQTTVNVTYTAAQTAGDLNVVVVGWNDSTATVSSVTDSKGNVYTRAVGPTDR